MKYSLRSLMIVMFLAAICAAWLADHRRLAIENGRLADELEQLKRPQGADWIVSEFGGPIQNLPTSQAPAPNPKP